MVYSRKIIYKNKNLRKRSRKGGVGVKKTTSSHTGEREKVSLTKVTPEQEAQSILNQVLETNNIDNHEKYLKSIVKIENLNKKLLNTNQFFSKCSSNNLLLGRYNNYVMTSGQITKKVYDNVFSNNDNIVVHLSNNLNLTPLFKYNNSSEKEFLNQQHMDILTPMNINKKESFDKASDGNKAYFFDLAMYGCIPSYWTNILLERICKKIKHDDREIIKKFSEVCLNHRYNQFAFNKIKLEYITLNEENIQSMQKENYTVDDLLSIKNNDKIMRSVTFKTGTEKPITEKLVSALNDSPKIKRYILFIILIIIPNIDNPNPPIKIKDDFIDKITKILELKKTILEFDPNSFYYTSFLKDIFGVEGDGLVDPENVSFLQTFVKTTIPPGLDGSIIDLFDGIFFLTYDLFEATNFLYTFNTQVNEIIATKNSMIVNKPELTQYVTKIKELLRYVDDETINFIPKNGLPDTIICDMEADDMALVLLIDYFRKRHKKNNVSESEIPPLNIYLQIENIEELKKKGKFKEKNINAINTILKENGVEDTREYDVEEKFKLVIDNINFLHETDKNLSLLLDDDDNLRVDKYRIEHVIRKTWIPFYTTTFYEMMKKAGDLRSKANETPNLVDAANYLEGATRLDKQAREIKTKERKDEEEAEAAEEASAAAATAAAGGKKRKTKNKKTKKSKKRRRHTKRRR